MENQNKQVASNPNTVLAISYYYEWDNDRQKHCAHCINDGMNPC